MEPGQTMIILVIALPIGIFATYLIMKAYTISRKAYEELQGKLVGANRELDAQRILDKRLRQDLELNTNELAKEQEQSRKQETVLAELRANYSSTQRLHIEEKSNNQTLQESIDAKQTLISDLKAKLSRIEAQNNSLQEKLETHKSEIEEIRRNSLLEFKSVANSLLEEKSLKFSKSNQENIERILTPLKENLKEFKQKVEETYDKESKERFSLESKIKDLVELNNQISKDATNLTNALKGQAKTQGNWGEMILENILECSGLVKDREYFTQESFTDNDGRKKQPDVLVKYPGNRCIIIDSKVSLTAYEKFANCEDTEEQKLHLKDHVKSIKNHIDNLSSKEYEKLDNALDFVLLFVPVEPAYMTVIHYDQELWNYAYKERVLLISPTNLIAALKMVSDIWNREHQNTNALKIAKRGETLYSKFAGFVSDMEDLEKYLGKASDKFDDAMNKLSKGKGNLIGQAQTLKSLGIQSKKELPEKYLIDNEELKVPLNVSLRTSLQP